MTMTMTMTVTMTAWPSPGSSTASQILASLGEDPKVKCRGEYKGFCHYSLSSDAQCPSVIEVWAWDFLCWGLFNVIGVEMIKAHPVHWLLHANSWGLAWTGLLQVSARPSAQPFAQSSWYNGR